MHRSKFLKTIASVSLCGGALAELSSCTSFRYVDGNWDGTHLKVSKEAFGTDPFVLVENPVYAKPIYLLRETEDSYSAYLLECTHKQCTVKPTGSTLTCPCHGSKYNQQGQVINGPAEEGLPSIKVTSNKQFIFLQLKKRT